MYRISKKENNIIKLKQRNFGDLGFKERDHLQEWIAKNPDVLGEELLIIQKEFQGFNDTKERLDLLALDKDGGVVVIENKLDDSGRDVVWQALKYTSYCSTLTNEQIIKIYQEYLDAYEGGGDAAENILEFLDRETDDDLLLNSNDQRIFFIANNYRKEVTSTVLWLLDHDIQIKCFKATPYSLSDDLFLQIEQIIPLPETSEFMIDAHQKQKEKKGKSKKVESTNARLIHLWGKLKNELSARGINYLDRVKPRASFSIAFYKGHGLYQFCIGKKFVRVNLLFGHDLDKKKFNMMLDNKSAIEQSIPEIQWHEIEGKKRSKIALEMTLHERDKMGSINDEENDDKYIEWYINSMVRFYNCINPILQKVQTKF